LSIANDGTATVTIAHADPGNIWIVDASLAAQASEPHALTSDSVKNAYARFSPEGRRIAFSQVPGGGPPATTWLMDADGKNVEQLSPGTQDPIQFPQFSRDGERVLVAIDGKSKPTLAWITLSTRQMTPVATDWWPTKQRLLFPTLSPDNQDAAYHLSDAKGVLNVWRLPLGPGTGRQITFDQESASFPNWSPDAKWLTVSVKRGAGSFLGIVSSHGGNIEPLTSVSEFQQAFGGGWAPDGDQIAFAGQQKRIWNIYTVSRRSKQVSRRTNFIDTEGSVIMPTWSPTGDQIIFERDTPAVSTIWRFKIGSK
jgi:Tol biopolymer transport system component